MINPESRGKYLDQQSAEEILREKRERAEEKAQRIRRERYHRWMWALALVAGAGGMIHMILNGLIDKTIGVWVLAVLCAVCGRGTGA